MSLHSQAQLGLGLGQGLPAFHPPPREPGSSTQRWEHRTAVFTFSTKAVTSVWYSMSALDVSLFLTGQSRGEGWPACRNGVGALLEAIRHLCACPGIGGAYRELGRYPSELPTLFPAPPPPLALLGCPRTAPSRSSLAWGLCAASQRQPKGPGGRTVSSEESLDDRALGCQGTAEKLGAWPHWARAQGWEWCGEVWAVPVGT